MHKFQVSITDPVKHGDALMGYTLYRVTTQTTMPEYPSTSGSYVLRRYSDFEWLHLAVRKCVVCFAPLPLAHSLTRLHHGWAQQVNRTAAPASRSATHPSNTQSNRDVWGSVTGQTLRWLDAAETYGCVGWGWGGCVCSKLPGCIPPPLPEKIASGRFEQEFVEQRMSDLGRFINKMANNPLVQVSSYY